MFLLSSVSPAFAGTAVQDTDLQFNAGFLDQLQVYGTGNSAVVQLLSRWQQVPVLNPPPARCQSPLVYLAGPQAAFMFDGWGNTVLNDGWKFSVPAQSWSQVVPYGTGPTARYGHGLVPLDDSRLLLFGGSDYGNNFSNETWIYDTQTNCWTQSISPVSPSPRAFFALTADPGNNKVVLFGGKDQEGNLLSDTWVFDIASSSWSQCSPGSHPGGRTGASMTVNTGNGLLYLFGGREGPGFSSLKQDLWSYDVAADTWAFLLNGGPSAREDAALYFDQRYGQVVLFGGADIGGLLNDVYYFTGTVWRSGVPLTPPTPRSGHALTFIPGMDRLLLFGGYDAGGVAEDTYFLIHRSSGTFTSTYFDAGSQPTSLQWTRLEAAPASQPAAAALKFQIASSADNIAWGPYSGPDGTPESFYDGQGPHTPWAGHNNCRYLRYRAFLNSGYYFGSPQMDKVTVTYNRSPAASLPASPLNGASTAQCCTVYSWQNAFDADGDVLTYQILIGTWPAFVEPAFSCDGIVAQSGLYTTFVSTLPLASGRWYWRVKAFDGTAAGELSNAFLLYVDTIPPAAVSDLSGQTGQGNGSARLTFSAPGDDGLSGAITNGTYQVRFATFGPVSPELYGLVSGQRQGQFNAGTAGAAAYIDINGLADATTYYFALRIADEAGNFSGVSSASPPVLTNAPPTPALLIPSGGESWSGTEQIAWNSSDPNYEDTATFALFASTDAGVSFGVTIATGLPDGTTCFFWDSRAAPSGVHIRIKVRATDARGLSGEGVSAADLMISNPNEAPAVTLLYPAGGETLNGSVTVRWNVSDYNRSDTHHYDLAISSDGGSTFFRHLSADSTSYVLDTRLFPNGPLYRIKVTVTDSGSPQMSGETVSPDFSINNGNLPPRPFALVSPLDGSSRSPLNFEFVWENNGDPNTEDTLTYTLVYSTSASATEIAVSGIRGNMYRIDPSLLPEETTCYWRVTARDPLGLETACAETSRAFVLSRYRTGTPDGRVTAEIRRGLPANGYLSISAEDSSAVLLQAAEADMVGDRHLASLGEDAYRIAVCDMNGTLLNVESPSITVSMQFQGDGYYGATQVPVSSLRCAMLNAPSRRWELLPLHPVVERQTHRISTELTRCGVISLVGALTPVSKLSAVVNYPNPFSAGNEETRIRYVLTQDGDTQLRIYTLTGDLVWERSFPAGSEGGKGQPAGYTNEVFWDGKNGAGRTVANGMYILEIRSSGERQTRRIGIVK
jgi:hypothetical protein